MMQIQPSNDIPAQNVINEIKTFFPAIEKMRDIEYVLRHPYNYRAWEYHNEITRNKILSKEMDAMLKKYDVPNRSKAHNHQCKHRLLHWFLEDHLQHLASVIANEIHSAIITDEDANAIESACKELSGIQTFPDFEQSVQNIKNSLPESQRWEEKLPYQKAFYPEAQAIIAQLSAATGLEFVLYKYGSLEYHEFNYFVVGNSLLSHVGCVNIVFSKLDFDHFHADLKDGIINPSDCKDKKFFAPYTLGENVYRIKINYRTYSRKEIYQCLIEDGQLIDVLGNGNRHCHYYSLGLGNESFTGCSRRRLTGEEQVGKYQDWSDYAAKLRKFREAGLVDESINEGYQMPDQPGETN